MGEMQRLLPKAVSLTDEPAIVDPEQSTASPAPSYKTVTAPPIGSNSDVKSQSSLGNAIFSTYLGSRAPQGHQDPRFVRAIVRSDMVMDVVIGAEHLLRKYPYQYLNIFPRQGWQIGDLWDDYDIQIEGEVYFTEMLGFIERDNVVRMQKYAYEHAYKYPERQTLIGGEMAGFYDKANPLSIVDKLFVNGESQDYPPVFLWKVADFMRTSMLTVKNVTVPPNEAVNAPEHPVIDQKDPAAHSTVQVPASFEGNANVPVATSTAAKPSAPAVRPATTVPTTTWHQERQSPHIPAVTPAHGRFVPPVGPVVGADYIEPMGHVMPVLPTHHAGGPNVAHPGLRNPRTRPGRSVPVSHNQIMPATPYIENMPRIPSGLGLRQHAGPMSPRFNQAHVGINHMIGNVPPGMVPFGYDQGPMGPGTMTSQPHPVNVLYPGSLPPHPMQGAPMVHAYPRQPSNMQGPPFAPPMGDMTNMHYGGPPGLPMQNMDSRRLNDRRHSQQHANGNALYDPYEGGNAAFRNSGYPGGKKYSQNGLHNSTGRQRKPSFPGNRPYHNQHTNGRPQAGGPHNSGPKPWSEDDRAITQDREYGCHVDWIGPQNETVNELFVKDLPEDVQDAELEALFQERLGVKPTSVNVRFSPQFPQQLQGRRHAFVGFPTTAIAKQALIVHSPTILGLPVSITVPKRFFQKTLDVPPRDMVEAGPSAYSRYTSKPNHIEDRNRVSSIHESNDATVLTTATQEKSSYSPQDARSDLHKKKKGKQTQQAQTAAGSPEARKVKPKKRQDVPVKEKPATPTERIETGVLDLTPKDNGHVSVPVVVEKTTSGVSTQANQSPASNVTLSIVAKEEVTTPVDSQDVALGLGAGSAAPKAVLKDPPQAALQWADPETQQMVEPRTGSVVKDLPVKPRVDAEDTIAQSASSICLQPEEPTSDDRLKNEASFHSAAESQSDLKVKVEPKVGSDIANHGTAIPVPKVIAATIIYDPAVSALAIKKPEKDIIPSEDVVVHTTAGNESTKLESKPTTMPPAESTAVEIPAAAQQEANASTSITLVVEQIKKSGPQQTEGLGLYPSKKQRDAQAKKEREQKKKAQKKDKELAQKAKAEKAAASKTIAKVKPADDAMVKVNNAVHDKAKPAVGAESASTNSDPAATTQDVEKTQPSAKEPSSSATSHEAANNSRDKPGKRKGKTADISAAKDTAPQETKNEDHGKQTNGTNIPRETGSVTNNNVEAESQEKPQGKPQEISKGDALASDAQSSNQDDTKKASSSAPEANTTVPPGEVPTPSGKKKNRKKKKNPPVAEGQEEASEPPLTWPNLEFRPKSPNPAWMGPIDMETDVQNYEEIMNKTCGGSDDSDFSWSDLPAMEDVLVSDKGDVPADHASGSEPRASMDVNEVEKTKIYSQALFPKVKKLQPDMAVEIMARIINVTTIEEMATLVTDNSALVAKVDEIVLFHQGQDAADMKGSQSVTGRSSVVVQEEIVDRSIAALGAQIGKPSFDLFVDPSLTFTAAKKEEMRAADVSPAVYDEQLTEHTGSLETSSADDGRIAALTAQLAATKVETAAAVVNIAALDKQRAERIAGQEPSDTVSPDSRPAKKKKANKHKNKKKKKPAKSDEASQSGDNIEPNGGTDSTPSKSAVDPVDPKDSFAHQLSEVDAIIKQGQNGAADMETSAQLRGGAAALVDEPTLMRAMEAYFREAHPERRSKGRKALQEDM